MNDTLLLFKRYGTDKWELYYYDGKPRPYQECKLSKETHQEHWKSEWLFVNINNKE